jgi:hypothetical protein
VTARGPPKNRIPKRERWRVSTSVAERAMRERGGSFREAIEFADRFVSQAARDPAPAPQVRRQRHGAVEHRTHHMPLALGIWKEAVPIAGTIAAVYLARRNVAIAIDGTVLRFRPSCPFGNNTRHPCLIVLMRDILTNEPRAIQRTALTSDGEKIGRMTLGPKTGAAVNGRVNDADERGGRAAQAEDAPAAVRATCWLGGRFLGHPLRAQGVPSLSVSCELCHHGALVNVDAFDDRTPLLHSARVWSAPRAAP